MLWHTWPVLKAPQGVATPTLGTTNDLRSPDIILSVCTLPAVSKRDKKMISHNFSSFELGPLTHG